MKILLLTSIYKTKYSNIHTTSVINSFTENFIKLGHELIVIHSSNKFIRLFYLIPLRIKEYIQSEFGVVLPLVHERKETILSIDRLRIARLPLLKLLPFRKFSKKTLVNQYEKIICLLEKENFIPNLILGHWENPQIDLIYMLQKKYPVARTSLVIHNIKYLNNDNELLVKTMSFHSIGFRNPSLMGKYLELVKSNKQNLYLCPSGISNFFYHNNLNCLFQKFDCDNLSISYVGRLIKRKNVATIIKSLLCVKTEFNFILNIVGGGREMNVLKMMAKKCNSDNKIVFNERFNKYQVRELLINSQIFTMVSKDEAFGLVYLEAMACGCIVIASRGEGFDGIIINGVNGFLCESGDYLELFKIYQIISKLAPKEKKDISMRAVNTSKLYSESLAAQHYLTSSISP